MNENQENLLLVLAEDKRSELMLNGHDYAKHALEKLIDAVKGDHKPTPGPHPILGIVDTIRRDVVVSGILDVLDKIDHKDWQGEAIQDLRNALEPTPALPPDDKRCIQIQDVQRCINEATDGHKIYCECGHNFGPDPESKPDVRLCFVPECETPHARGLMYCRKHYNELFNKPVPNPPYIPNTSETPEETLARINGPDSPTCPTCDCDLSMNAKAIEDVLSNSTTCPARKPVLGMEAVTIANAALTSWHADSTANLEQLCVEVVRATEKHHGIKP